MDSKRLTRRIFIQQAAAAGITLAGLSGCGSGSGDFIFTDSGNGAGVPNNVVPPPNSQDLPLLTATARVEAAVMPGRVSLCK